MAKISISIGQVTSEKVISDNKATSILDYYFRSLVRQQGARLGPLSEVVAPPTTPKGKLDYILEHITANITEVAKSELSFTRLEETIRAIEEELKELDPNGNITTKS